MEQAPGDFMVNGHSKNARFCKRFSPLLPPLLLRCSTELGTCWIIASDPSALLRPHLGMMFPREPVPGYLIAPDRHDGGDLLMAAVLESELAAGNPEPLHQINDRLRTRLARRPRNVVAAVLRDDEMNAGVVQDGVFEVVRSRNGTPQVNLDR